MKALVLGAAGMAGHVVAQYLRTTGHHADTVARSTARVNPTYVLDLFHSERLGQIISEGAYDVVVNCVGLLIQDSERSPADAAYVNAYLPHHLARLTQASSTRLVHLSTDCVFSGQNGPYREDSPYDGQRIYDRSKALGEVVNDRDLTVRMSIIGPELGLNGTGLFDWFAGQDGTIQGFTLARWNGITTIELARAIASLAASDTTGLVHLVPQESVTKFELLNHLNRAFEHELTIDPVAGYQADKRLLHTRDDVPFEVRGYEAMLSDMRSWIQSHPDSYPHYQHLLEQ